MSIVEKVKEKYGELKSWQEGNLRGIEKEYEKSKQSDPDNAKTHEDRAFDQIKSELRKSGIYLKDSDRRDLFN